MFRFAGLLIFALIGKIIRVEIFDEIPSSRGIISGVNGQFMVILDWRDKDLLCCKFLWLCITFLADSWILFFYLFFFLLSQLFFNICFWILVSTNFKEQWIYSLVVVSSFFSDHTSVYCSSFVDLHILIPCRQSIYALWHIFLLLFLPSIPQISQSCSSLFGNFLWHTIFIMQVVDIFYKRILDSCKIYLCTWNWLLNAYT